MRTHLVSGGLEFVEDGLVLVLRHLAIQLNRLDVVEGQDLKESASA